VTPLRLPKLTLFKKCSDPDQRYLGKTSTEAKKVKISKKIRNFALTFQYDVIQYTAKDAKCFIAFEREKER